MKFFLWLILVSFVIFLFIYPLLVRISVPPQGAVPWMFRTYVLQSHNKLKGPNIWIDSGSNSLYSIDTKMLAQAFNCNVYMLSDSAGFPWDARFYQLLDFVQPGDVVIFPMEFEQYVKKNSIAAILGPHMWKLDYWQDYAGYMHIKKPVMHSYVDAVKTHPGTLLFLWRRYFNFLNQQQQNQRLAEYQKRIKKEGDFEYTLFGRPELDKEYPIDEKTDVFEPVIQANFKLREDLNEDLEILNKLQAKGVTVIWTWPASIWTQGDRTEFSQQRAQFYHDVVQRMELYHIPVVADPESSMFGPEAFLDGNPYHLKQEYVVFRTQQLIDSLKQSQLINNDHM